MTEQATTHPREEFRGYAAAAPPGDWSYVLDDFGVSYTSGLWPYHRDVVRLSPDTEYRAWDAWYVMLWQNPRDTYLAAAELSLVIRPQEMGAWTVRVSAHLDLRDGSVTFDPDDLDGELRAEAENSVRRVLELLAAERVRRDGPERPGDPETAYDRWVARTDPFTGRPR